MILKHHLQQWLCYATLAGLLVLVGCAPLAMHTQAPPLHPASGTTVDAKHSHDVATRDRDPVPATLNAQDASVDGVPMADNILEATDMAPIQLDPGALRRFGNVWETLRAGFMMPPQDNSRIDLQRSWFAGHQSYLDRMTDRASRYLGYTAAEAARRHLPTELALLPVIESAYDPFAVSRAQAVGMWQFVPGTGRVFGLRESSGYDGRRDIIDSTRAAYDFLGSLYDRYHDWNLVLAAYNAGPGLIDKAIARNVAAGLGTDYWSLSLPAETMAYVPRFLAMVQIVTAPEKYGVHLNPIVNDSYFRIVSLPGSVDLNAVSRLAGISFTELHALNPGFSHGVTDPQGPQRLLLPANTDVSIDASLSTLPAPQRLPARHYVVRHGDNLFRISRRFGMTPGQLMALNHLHTHHLHHGQFLLVVAEQSDASTDTPSSSSSEATAGQNAQTTSADNHQETGRHRLTIRVRHQATLRQIAAHYQVSVHDLAAWNGLHPQSRCHRGQRLRILVAASANQSATRSLSSVGTHAAGRSTDRHKIRYAVRRGDTLFSISKRYRVTIQDIRSWNHGSRHNLHPGQDLVLYVAKSNRNES